MTAITGRHKCTRISSSLRDGSPRGCAAYQLQRFPTPLLGAELFTFTLLEGGGVLGVSAPNNPMAPTIQRIRFKNILYLTDFSPASHNALPYARAVAEHYGARIHVSSPEVYMYLPPESLAAVMDAATAFANESMRKLTSSGVFGDIPHTAIIKHGEIWDVLNTFSSSR